MIWFTDWSHDILIIKSKLIQTDYKIWAVTEKKYILQWIWHRKKKNSVDIKYSKKLNKTETTVLHLLNFLLTQNSSYEIWLDNLFTSIKLLEYLKKTGYGTTETCQINSDICEQFVEKKKIDRKKNVIEWEILFQESTMSNEIIQSAWKNNVLILFLLTTHETADTIM